jgi:hypothetical protein
MTNALAGRDSTRLVVLGPGAQRVMRASAVAVLVLAAVTPALAQKDCPQPSAQLTDQQAAVRFAPTFRFAPGEGYFPTLPFFSAADGVDNDGNSKADSQDPMEILPVIEKKVDHETHVTWYSQYSKEKRENTAVVFYRVRHLLPRDEEHERFWRFLRSDEQLFKRLDNGALEANGCLHQAPLMVIEYYSSYANDTGIEGHAGDVEFAFVFVPRDSMLAESFRTIVGAGHSLRSPNNTLVLHGELARRNPTINILVELGGHASAPDIDPLGTFEPGHDVNWNPDDIWGVRDAMATSGRGFYGDYATWMTFPRVPSQSVTMERRSPGTADQPWHYDLVDANVLRTFYESLRSEQWDNAIQSLVDLQKQLSPHWDLVPLINALNSDRTSMIAQRVRMWPDSLRSIPDHAHYRSPPGHIFKSHLYPPNIKVGWGRPQISIGFDGALNDPVAGIGWMLPDFGFFLELPGTLEFHVDARVAKEPQNERYRTDLLYTRYYGRALSWYVKMEYEGWLTHYRKNEGWRVGGGLSIMGTLAEEKAGPRLLPFDGDWRIRVGVTNSFALHEPRFEIDLIHTLRKYVNYETRE